MFSALLLAAMPLQVEQFNTARPEYGLVAGPDGHYVTRQDARWGEQGRESIWVHGEDRRPRRPAWADAACRESDFFFDPATRRAYFVSDRHDPGDADIWQLAWDGAGWGPPERLPAPVNSPQAEFSPVVANDGSLCFASARPGGAGQGDLYCASLDADGRWLVEPLAPSINSTHGEWNLAFSPDGGLLLFESSGRETNISIPGDLYVSRRDGTAWSAPVPLSRLNTAGSDLMPRFLPDGSLVYASAQAGDANLLRADPRALGTLAPALAAIARSSGEVVLLDPRSLEVAKRIAVGGGPHEIASSEDGRVSIVPLHGQYPAPHAEPIAPGELKWLSQPSPGFAVVDLVTGRHRIVAMDGCPRPHGVAATAQANRVWITCEEAGEIRELDVASGRVRHTVETGPGVHKVMLLARQQRLAASNPQTGEAYLLNLADGALTIFETGKGAEALAASADHATVWVANAFARTVCAIDVPSNRLGSCYASGGAFPIALAVDEAAGRIWVARNGSSDLAALSLRTGEIHAELPLPSPPLGMAFDARTRRIYVSLPRLNEIVALDADRLAVVARASDVMEVDDLDLLPAAHFGTPPDT